MEWVTSIILVSIINYGTCKDCVLPRPKEKRPEANLYDDLQRDYDIFEEPKPGQPAGVKVDYYVIEFYFSGNEEMLTIYGRNRIEWQDDRLKWDVDKYKGLKSIHMYNFEIWSPLLKLKNKAKVDDGLFDLYKCDVNNTGTVTCFLEVEHSIMCGSTIKYWPYDKKNCTFEFDDQMFLQLETNIIFTEVDLLFFKDAKINNGWRVVAGGMKNNLTGDHQVSLEFFLERKAECLEASIIIPSFILSVLTVTSLLLHFNNDVRLGILCFNFLNHFVISREIIENIPRYGYDTPVILFFLSLSTVWTILIAFLTFFLRYISKLTTTPASFLVLINSIVFNSFGKHFVIPRWNVEVLDKSVLDTLSHCTEWIDFSNIINSISLYVTLIAYIIMFSIYMPHDTVHIVET